MKRKHKILIILLAVSVTISLTTVPAFALTESEVQDQVNAVGKESVTGNLFVWFLCAIAFLKVSQKIDSFMSSLGINVGHTGGSMLAEAMIAMRGIGVAKNYAGKVGGSGRSSGGGGNTFMKGGLSGVVSRKVTNTAINNANGSKSGGLGGMAFNSSLGKGGGFANSVIGKIATGNISSTGSISGESAADSLMSYMGYTALGPDAEGVPSFSDVEIGIRAAGERSLWLTVRVNQGEELLYERTGRVELLNVPFYGTGRLEGSGRTGQSAAEGASYPAVWYIDGGDS